MSGDRLAQFERNIGTSNGLVVVIGVGFAQDVLDVAKEARELVKLQEKYPMAFPSFFDALRSALARLDSGATEGDA